jgi:hypothetical protein
MMASRMASASALEPLGPNRFVLTGAVSVPRGRPLVAIDPFFVAGAEAGESRKSVHVITTYGARDRGSGPGLTRLHG